MKLILFCFSILSLCKLDAQGFNEINPLPSDIQESSGLLYFEGNLITINDSGGENALFEINPTTATIERKVIVQNASNVDWEALAKDDHYFYIGDFGNNNGSRTDLKIYRIAIAEYSAALNDTVYADTIHFSYEDQVDFSPSPSNTNFDCEAMIYWEDSLCLFTKNWIDLKTNIYKIPVLPGTYIASKIDSLNPEFLVTGADYYSNQLVLVGYTVFDAYLYQSMNFYGDFNTASFHKNTYSGNPNSDQVEGVSFSSNNCVYFSSEDHISGEAYLNEWCQVAGLVNGEGIEWELKPGKQLVITSNYLSYSILTMDGRMLSTNEKAVKTIDLSHLTPGNYIITFQLNADLATKIRLTIY